MDEDDKYDGHTPGPWRVAEGNSFNSSVYVMFGEPGRDLEICEVFDDSEDMPLDALANARLIASAPEMLNDNAVLRAALREALGEWESNAQYKGEYLREKHGDAEEIEKFRALINEMEAKYDRME